ncbi:MAG TPA: hypothetical protein VEL81_02995 [Thermoplasmata archaeon]|nr:hypothetical protein [Thermoplasmata archaeon]
MDGRKRFLRRRLAITFGAILLISLAGAWFYLESLPPRDLGLLAAGRVFFDVPLLTRYTLPEMGPNASVETTVGISGTEPLYFRWIGTASDGSPLRFVIRPDPNSTSLGFDPVEEDSFVFHINGRTTGSSPNPAEGSVWALTWVMDYSARRIARYDGFFERTWIEIGFVPRSLIECICSMPYANVTYPGDSDLMPTGIVDQLTSAGPWSYERVLSDFVLPAQSFDHETGPISIDVGPAGTVSAIVASAFHWGPAGEYRVTAAGDGPVRYTITWYWDARFGGLYPAAT